VTPEEHGCFRAVALGLPNREILCVTPEERVLYRALALGLSNKEVLIRDS
jgi:DNA-binding CsgD family transcriptional regulator